MKFKIILTSVSVVILTSCIGDIKNTIKKSTEVGKQDIRYYADKTVNNLEIPPDLTKPSQKNSLNLDKFIDDDKNLTTFDESKIKTINSIKTKNISISVKRSDNRRWLIVGKNADYIWKEAKEFLKDSGFRILKENKKIGILETNFLESRANIPNQNLGLIRSMFKNAFKARYALPTLDKYRIRLEVIDKNTTEVYLSLKSMREVVTNKGLDNENTIWQEKDADTSVEAEMLYRLMIYLGSDKVIAKEKMEAASIQNKISVGLKAGINGFAKMQFNLNNNETWDAISWGFDKLNIDIADRDKGDGSLYINVAGVTERGIMSRIFGDTAIKENFQIKVKSINKNFSEVYFIDLSRENSESTKEFSKNLFAKIVEQF